MSFPRYEGYKDSGVDWLGEVPSRWSVMPLKRGYRIIGGSTPKSDNDSYWDGDIVWITPADLSRLNGLEIENSLKTITLDGLDSCGTKLVPPGSVVLSTRAPIGSLGIAAKELCTNQGCKSLVPRAGQVSKYQAYVLGIATAELNIRGKGTTFLEISSDELGSFIVAFPSTREQRTIIDFLDRETAKIDALVEEQQRLIALLKEKRQAVISHAVTKGLDPDVLMKSSGLEWPTVIPARWQILNLTRVVRTFVDYRGATPNKVAEGIPLITAGQIKNGRIDHTLDPAFISEVEYVERMTRGFPEVGDVLLTTEAPLGETAQIEDERVAPGQRIIMMKPDPSLITKKFLYLHFRSDFGQNQLYMRGSGSTALGIRADRLRGSPVIIPPLTEQERIAEYIDRQIMGFDAIEAEAESTISLLQERRSALISAAVTGKIDVCGLAPVAAEAA